MNCSLRVTPVDIVLHASKTVKLSKKVIHRVSDLMAEALVRKHRFGGRQRKRHTSCKEQAE